jgi:hypothetical protein
MVEISGGVPWSSPVIRRPIHAPLVLILVVNVGFVSLPVANRYRASKA